MFDLAGEAKEGLVAPDISDYVRTQNTARLALRKARDLNLGDKEWMKVIEILEKGKEKNADR